MPTDPFHADADAEDLGGAEALLRAAAPAPSTAWEAELERRLFTPRRSLHRRLITATATATALAAAVVVAGMAGGGPLAPDGGDGARAKPGCTTVYVTEMQDVGQVVRRSGGAVTVEATKRPVTRERQRCTKR